ncbi:MAG TPA: DUF4388 domain-containing protein [Roseiflexaceae bacterium]|nr:DUF4388 domain-containing protein [Roseiflexaceae bacterium]
MALEGNLLDMSLVDLFQIFRMGPKTGILVLSADNERGVVYVAQGQLLDAVMVRGKEREVLATGEEAVLRLLQWEDASFTFRHDTAVLERPARIVHDSEWLILEGMRRRENPLRALPHQHITMETRLALASLPGSAESGVNLDLDQWRILSQIAISQNLGEICEKVGMSADQAVRTVTELVAIGLVETVIASAPQPVVQRPRAEIVYRQPALQPAMATVGGPSATETATAPSRGLLQAIMRRVRGI